MYKKIITSFFLVLGYIVAILNYIANYEQIKSEIPWLDIEMVIILSLVLIIVIMVFYYKLYGKGSDDKEIQEVIVVYKDEKNAKKDVEADITNNDFKRVRLIEYSTVHAKYILESLIEKGNVSIRIMICNPLSAVSNKQQNRICEQIPNLAAWFNKYYLEEKNVKLTIKCYNISASLRGRVFDDKLAYIGWYTYEEKKEHTLIRGKFQVHGKDNCIIRSEQQNGKKSELIEMFNQVFENMWNNNSSFIREVCENCQRKNNMQGCPKKDWLNFVSY